METNLKNFNFATPRVARAAAILATVIDDGGRYQSAIIIANTSQSVQPLKNGCPYRKDDVRKDCKYGVSLNGCYSKGITKRLQTELNEAIERGEVPTGTTVENYKPKQNWHFRLFDGVNGSIVCKRSEVEAGIPISEIYLLVTNDYSEVLQYYVHGKLATVEEVEKIKVWRADRAESAAKSQGLANKESALVVSTIAFSNITEIRANGVRLEL